MIMPIKSKFENMLEDYICALLDKTQDRSEAATYPYRNALLDYDKAQQEQIEILREALKQCERWHHGDKWRDGDTEQREAWEGHLRVIKKALEE